MTPSAAHSLSFQIWLKRRPHLRTGPMQEHPSIGLLNAERVTHLLGRAALDVTKGQHQPLVRWQRVDRLLELLASLPAEEPMLRGGPEVARRACPVAGLGRVVRGPEAVRADRGLRRADVIGAEAGERHRPPFACGAGLRAVDEDAEDPRLEGRAAFEGPYALDHAGPGVLHHLVRDSAIGDIEAGPTAEGRAVVVDEARERPLVTLAKCLHHAHLRVR